MAQEPAFLDRIPDELKTIVLVLVVFVLVVGVGAALGLDGDDGDSAGAPATTVAPEDTSSTEAPDTEAADTTAEPGDTAAPEDTQPGQTTADTAAPAATGTAPSGPLQGLGLEILVTEAGSLTNVTAPTGDDRIFFTTRAGKVVLIVDDAYVDRPFLDITDRVLAGGIEQGLLGLAFHPDYANNGRFFVYYTDKDGNRQLSEFSVGGGTPNRADPDSEKVIFELPQPENATDIRHYAGGVEFGPDGYLWVSLGDGADSRAQGQDPNTMYGSIVRIDIDGGDPYAIPPDNPFVSGGGAPEVWAYGMRNPWRISLDPVDRLLMVADVGHDQWEEVNVLEIDQHAGANLGWSNVEGNRCFHESDCNPEDYHVPVVTYNHDEGCSVTGGHIYRGNAIPELNGHYIYTDWCTGFVKTFEYRNGRAAGVQDWSEDFSEVSSINAFGFDGFGEMYLATHTGTVARIVPVR